MSSDVRKWLQVLQKVDETRKGHLGWLATRIRDSPVWPIIKERLKDAHGVKRPADLQARYAAACLLQLAPFKVEQHEKDLVTSIQELRQGLDDWDSCSPEKRGQLSGANRQIIRVIEPLLESLQMNPPKPEEKVSLGKQVHKMIKHGERAFPDALRRQVAEASTRFLDTYKEPSDTDRNSYIAVHRKHRKEYGPVLLAGVFTVMQLRNAYEHPAAGDGDENVDQQTRLKDFYNETGLNAKQVTQIVLSMAAYVCVQIFVVDAEGEHKGKLKRPDLDDVRRSRSMLERIRGARFLPALGGCLLLFALGWMTGTERAPPEPPSLRAALGDGYAASCAAVQQVQAERAGEYRERPLHMIHGLGELPPADDERLVTDADLVKRLVDGSWRQVLILAEGGSGKSWRAHALESGLCGALVTVRVSLRNLGGPVESDLELEQRLAAEVARSSGLSFVAAQRVERSELLIPLLRQSEWVLILDGLDEMPLAERRSFVAALNRLMGQGGLWASNVRVVLMGRPPLFDPDRYGLSVAPVLQLPSLSCEEVLEHVTSRYGPEGAERFASFIAERLDEREDRHPGQACRFMHMATFRQVGIVAALAEDAQTESWLREAGQAAIMAAYFERFWSKNLKGTHTRDATRYAQAIVDEVVLRQSPDAGPALRFSRAECEASAEVVLGSLSSAQTHYGLASYPAVCDRILNDLVVPVAQGTDGSLEMKNQSLADYLWARRFTRADANLPVRERCARLAETVARHGSAEVLTMATGMEGGLACLGELAALACARDNLEQATQLFERGLPRGAQRQNALDEWCRADSDACRPVEPAEATCRTKLFDHFRPGSGLGMPHPDRAP